MIKRFYSDLEKYLRPNKVLVIYGPRRVGKTTLLKEFLSKTRLKYKFVTGNDIKVQEVIASENLDMIARFVDGYDLLAIDEAQYIPKVGLGLKILIDNVAKLKIIATGSSSFELSGQVGEPLTGRKVTLKLYPISQLELRDVYNEHELSEKLEKFLIFGGYPEVISSKSENEKKEILDEIVSSYMLRDILALEEVKGSKILLDLVRLLAFQIGSEVSLNELSSSLAINIKTVARYLDLMEKSFILYNLRGYSRNLRDEITKKSKYYFLDNGIRNAVIASFNGLNLRDDVGKLWENFLVSERLKKQSYQTIYSNNYFWRTWEKDEIDWIEEREGKVFGYEFKYKSGKIKGVDKFKNAYSNSEVKIVNRENYLEFIT